MRKTKIFALISLASISAVFCPAICNAASGGFITLLSPSVTSTKNSSQMVSGRVETDLVRQVSISVEPFTLKKSAGQPVVKAAVINGSFSEKVTLEPGLNIIRVSAGRSEIAVPVYLISQQKKENASNENWGAQAQIVFTSPTEPKTNSREVSIKGVVTNPNITSIDAAIMNTMYFLSEDASAGGDSKGGPRKIDYKSVPVKNMQFEIKAQLTEGLNVILARPDGKPAIADKIQIMSLVYEKVSEQLLLEEPQLEKGGVAIRGKVIAPGVRKVRLNITALVENELKPGVIAPVSLLDTTVNVESDGSFAYKASLQDKKGVYTIKYSPTITVFTENSSASKTLIKWQ